MSARTIVTIAKQIELAYASGEDVGGVLAAACRMAASRLHCDLTGNRPGSWEAEHVRGLSAGWDI